MSLPETSIHRSITVPGDMAGLRLDVALARLFPAYSRSTLKRWLQAGSVRIDQRPGRPSERVSGGEHLELEAAEPAGERWRAQPGPIAIVHEDRQLVVVDKPAGLVTHPGAGNREGTLVNLLLHRYPELAALPRAGIVHRLDKDTSGLLVCARVPAAHASLVAQLGRREVSRQYLALVKGRMLAGGRIEAPIGRDPRQRTRMAVRSGGRPAATRYRVAERFAALTLLEVELETGRTHQIRVHCAHIGHPLVGDPLYAARQRFAAGVGAAARAALAAFERQALHARRLAFTHPLSGERSSFEAPLPADLAGLLAALRDDAPPAGT